MKSHNVINTYKSTCYIYSYEQLHDIMMIDKSKRNESGELDSEIVNGLKEFINITGMCCYYFVYIYVNKEDTSFNDYVRSKYNINTKKSFIKTVKDRLHIFRSKEEVIRRKDNLFRNRLAIEKNIFLFYDYGDFLERVRKHYPNLHRNYKGNKYVQILARNGFYCSGDQTVFIKPIY